MNRRRRPGATQADQAGRPDPSDRPQPLAQRARSLWQQVRGRRWRSGPAGGASPAGSEARSIGESVTAGYQRHWETRGERRRGRGRSVADEARTSYYGIAPIHKPHWKWLVITYFYLGGIAGASYALSSIAGLAGEAAHRRLTRVGRYISLAALLPSPILLILDLGRPERFHHMLRVFKIRSPLSVGTWALTLFGGLCTLSALIQAAEDGIFGRRSIVVRLLGALPSKTIGLLGTVPAFFVAGYTGVLLAATAVPLWTKSHLLMGPLFLASSMSNATAAITLALSLVGSTSAGGSSYRSLAALERVEKISLLAELGLLLSMRSHLGPVIGRPLREGRLAGVHHYGVLGLGLGLPLTLQLRSQLSGRAASRWATVLASLCVLSGGFLFRYVVVMAGRQSADDPQATFELTRGHLSPPPLPAAPPAPSTPSAPSPAG